MKDYLISFDELKDIFSAYKTSDYWFNFVIEGIENPQRYTKSSFSFTYIKSNKGIVWAYTTTDLIYRINDPPNFFSVQSISLTDYNIQSFATYNFTLTSKNPIEFTNYLVLSIKLPAIYTSQLYESLYCFISLTGKDYALKRCSQF